MLKVTVTFKTFLGDGTVESAQALVNEIIGSYAASDSFAQVTVTDVEEVTETMPPVDA